MSSNNLRFKIFIIFISFSFTATAQDFSLDWGFNPRGAGINAEPQVCLDAAGNVFMSSWYEDSIDLDPGSGVDIPAAARFPARGSMTKLFPNFPP